MKRLKRVLPILGVALVGAGLKLPSMYRNSPETRGDPHGWPVSLVQFEGSIESRMRGYLLAAVWIGGGLLTAIAIVRRRSKGLAPGFILGIGLLALAAFSGMTLMILQEGGEPLGNWSAGPGYYLGIAGGLLLIVSSAMSWLSSGPEGGGRSKTAPFLGVGLLLVGLITPVMYRTIPDIGSAPRKFAEPIVSFDGHINDLLSGYLLGVVLVGGGLWVATERLRNRNSASGEGVGLALGLSALAIFLGYAGLMLVGPNRDPYPEGPFSVGVGFFLGIAGALILVVACLPREEPVAELT